MPEVRIYTDGSAAELSRGSAQWSGSWAFHAACGGSRAVRFSWMDGAKNGAMEIAAIFHGLLFTRAGRRSEIHIISDSSYALSVFTGAAEKWEDNGWHNSTGPVKNLEWCQHSLALKRAHEEAGSLLVFHKTRGHDIDEGNNEADRLAGEARKGRLINWMERDAKFNLCVTSGRYFPVPA